MSVYVEQIPNRNSPPAILIRESRREGGKIKRRTLANVSQLPPGVIEGIRQLLKGGLVVADPGEAFLIRRALPHGHVCAVLGLCKQLALRDILHRRASRERDLALAAVVARLLHPASKLATARQLSHETATSSLGAVLDLGAVSGNELLAMLDWLLRRQPWIERSLANRHLRDGTLILYDLTSSYVEGTCGPLAAFGHNRDGKKGKMQITFGLLCAEDGCPVAVEVFSGNTSDPSTVAGQVARIRDRFGIRQVALVGDRGMLTTARIREDLEPAALDWISALKTTDIRKLLEGPARQSGRSAAAPGGVERRPGGRGLQPGLPGGTAHGLSQSAAAPGAGAQTRELAASHGSGPREHRHDRPPTGLEAPGHRPDQPPARARSQPPQGGKALRYHRHRRQARLEPQ